MSNEELENMLESLENETLNQEGAQSLASSHELTPESEGKSAENLGARPKEFHNAHSRIFRCFFEQMCHLKKKVHYILTRPLKERFLQKKNPSQKPSTLRQGPC